MPNYGDLLSASRDCPDKTAIEFKGERISYRSLDDRSRRVAAGLQSRRLGRSRAVGIMLPNTPEFLSITYGAFFSGATATPMSVLLSPPEARHVIRDSALSVVFIGARYLSVVEQAVAALDRPPEIVVVGENCSGHTAYADFLGAAEEAVFAPVEPDQHVLTLYTSGTTGPSKGVMISDRCLRSQVDMIGSTFQPEAGTRMLCVLPLFHAYALNAIMGTALRYRMTVILHERFEAAACATSLAKEGIQWFAGVPTMYAYVLEEGERRPELAFERLEVCLTGGAPMNPDVLSGFERRFGAPIYEGYGLTETTVSVASNGAPPESRKIGSVGRFYEGVEGRVVDDDGQPQPAGEVGELVFRGGNVMLGYLNRPEETAQVLKNGWLHSGDLGVIDEDGYCFIVGRKKDLIIKSGYNIVPLEVEDAVRCSGMVRDVCVVGVPDPVRGERILAAVILEDAAEEAAARADIERTIAARLAKYKHPNEIWFVNQFPLGPSGKVLKKAIREEWLENAETHGAKADVRITA